MKGEGKRKLGNFDSSRHVDAILLKKSYLSGCKIEDATTFCIINLI